MFSSDDLAARAEITDIVQRYATFMDEGEPEKFEALFAEDAVFDIQPNPGIAGIPAKGRKVIAESLFARRTQLAPTLQRRHVMSNTIFDELTATAARTRSYVTVFSAPKDGGAATLNGLGVYHDRFEKRDGSWLLVQRTFKIDVLK